jgi:GR25 family glycosyltransferase involved in LPS biosynthesis
MFSEPQRIKVIVVTVPGANRVRPLGQTLKSSSTLIHIKFNAVMYNRLMTQHKANFAKQRVLYSRELSDGEIGCAISHQIIQTKYKNGNEPIIVLEDDARIVDIKEFERVSREFVRDHAECDAILSLLAWSPEKTVMTDKKSSQQVIKLFGRTPLTVGYVITPKAMESLSKANSDYSYLPDWPPTRTKFYVTRYGVIKHGDAATDSLIDKSGRIKSGKLIRALRLTFIPYFLNRDKFVGIYEYFQFAFKPAITWRLDRIRIHLSSKSRTL